VIVGSALVRRIAEASGQPHDALLADVGRYVAELAVATR
jgi:tryptophan synthase alpha subunit